MKETKYTKEDWINGKVALEWEDNKAEGIAKYYYCVEKYPKGYYTCAYTTNLPIVKIDDIVMEEIYSIEDLKSKKNGKCWVVQIKNKEQYNFLLRYFPNMMKYDSIYDGYLVDKTNTGISPFSSYWKEEYNKITINQIKEYVMKEKEQLDNNNMEKKIRHYIVQKQCWGIKGIEWEEGEILYATNKDSLPYFKEIGLLDNTNYFTPVFEPEKPKEKVITLSNNKSVKIKAEGVEVENILIKIKYIENLFCNKNTFGDTSWNIQYNNFDIGCYKNLTREDLENILKVNKSLK